MDDLLSQPFLYREQGEGKRLDFGALCREAGMRNVTSMGYPPEIRLHDEPDDWIVALPGRRCYLLARGRLPADPGERAAAILKRLAYGAQEWAAREGVRAARRHRRDAAAPAEDVGERERRRILAETLPMRRLLRRDPGATDAALAAALGVAVDEVAALRTAIGSVRDTGIPALGDAVVLDEREARR